MKNRFLNISVGVSLMLLSGGFFLRSVPAATAAPTPETFAEEGTSKIGKYMFQVYVGNDGGRYGVIMNTETGSSKTFPVSDGQFPADPLTY